MKKYFVAFLTIVAKEHCKIMVGGWKMLCNVQSKQLLVVVLCFLKNKKRFFSR